MTIQLSSVEDAPRKLPYWDLMLSDLGDPPVRRLAKTLGVGESTIYRWNHAHAAPRAAHLALFWLTSWGRAAVHAQAVNDAQLACSYVAALHKDIEQLEGQVTYLLSLSHGSANDAAAPTSWRQFGLTEESQATDPAIGRGSAAPSVRPGRAGLDDAQTAAVAPPAPCPASTTSSSTTSLTLADQLDERPVPRPRPRPRGPLALLAHWGRSPQAPAIRHA